LHVATLGWHVPGYEVELVHVGGGVLTPASAVGTASGGRTGTGALVPPEPPPTPDEEPPAAAPVPPPEDRVAVPVPAEPVPDDPEQVVMVVGRQEKPSPQSASTVHDRGHRQTHWLRVDSEQLVGSTFTGSQTVLGGHGVVAAPPVQVVTVWLRQTMPVPQSVSAVQLEVWASARVARAMVATRPRMADRGLLVFIGAPSSTARTRTACLVPAPFARIGLVAQPF